MKNLNKLYWLKREVQQIENQIRELTILSAFEMTGMPSAHSLSSPVEQFYNRLDKLMTKLEKAKEKVVKETEQLESYIETVDDAEIRVLARMRYLDCMKFEDIGEECHMDRRTVSRKLENYFGKDDKQ